MDGDGIGPSADIGASARWVATAEGAHLRGRRTRNTAPEVRLRRAVHTMGLRYRLHRRVAGYQPDMVLPRHRLVVFVDGCYWHGCPVHGPREFRGPNADRWRAKLEANRNRDHTAAAVLEAAGWHVMRIWECETRRDVATAAIRVVEAAHRASMR